MPLSTVSPSLARRREVGVSCSRARFCSARWQRSFATAVAALAAGTKLCTLALGQLELRRRHYPSQKQQGHLFSKNAKIGQKARCAPYFPAHSPSNGSRWRLDRGASPQGCSDEGRHTALRSQRNERRPATPSRSIGFFPMR